MTDAIMIHCSCPTAEVAEAIATKLVSAKLAKCVQLLPHMHSFYEWENEIIHDQESLLVIKTISSHFDAIAEVIRERHPYDLPEIVATPITQGSDDYLNWLKSD